MRAFLRAHREHASWLLVLALLASNLVGLAGGYTARPIVERLIAGGFRPAPGTHATRPVVRSGGPASLDFSAPWRDGALSVHDQGSSNSCVLQSISSSLEWSWGQQGYIRHFNPLFDYQLVTGGSNRDTTYQEDIAVFEGRGVPRQQYYPYGAVPAPWPSSSAYYDAALHRAGGMQTIFEAYNGPYSGGGWAGVQDLHWAMQRYGQPIAIGLNVRSEWYAAFGKTYLPGYLGNYLFAHVMLAVGYQPGYTLVLNSWGSSFGQGGLILVPDWILSSEMFDAVRVLPGTIPHAAPPPAPAPTPRPTPRPALRLTRHHATIYLVIRAQWARSAPRTDAGRLYLVAARRRVAIMRVTPHWALCRLDKRHTGWLWRAWLRKG